MTTNTTSMSAATTNAGNTDNSVSHMETDEGPQTGVPATPFLGAPGAGVPATPFPGAAVATSVPNTTSVYGEYEEDGTPRQPFGTQPTHHSRAPSRAGSEAPTSPTRSGGTRKALWPLPPVPAVDPDSGPVHAHISDAGTITPPIGEPGEPEDPAQRIERVAAAFRLSKLVPEQKEAKGVIQFPPYVYPRSIGTRTLWPPYLADSAFVTNIFEMLTGGHVALWVSVYRTTNITESEVNLFHEALTIITKEKIIPDFSTDDYIADAPPKGGKAFLVLAKSLEAYRRLMVRKVITMRAKSKSATFFLQQDDSWGTHVIYDIVNGGGDFEKDILPRLWNTSGDNIAMKESKKKGVKVPVDLAYYLVPVNLKTHKGSKQATWRVRFIPTPETHLSSWTYPRQLGTNQRGAIEVRRPPFCSHCISNSHAQSLCQWWKDPSTAGSRTKPDGYLEHEWKFVKSFAPAKFK